MILGWLRLTVACPQRLLNCPLGLQEQGLLEQVPGLVPKRTLTQNPGKTLEQTLVVALGYTLAASGLGLALKQTLGLILGMSSGCSWTGTCSEINSWVDSEMDLGGSRTRANSSVNTGRGTKSETEAHSRADSKDSGTGADSEPVAVRAGCSGMASVSSMDKTVTAGCLRVASLAITGRTSSSGMISVGMVRLAGLDSVGMTRLAKTSSVGTIWLTGMVSLGKTGGSETVTFVTRQNDCSEMFSVGLTGSVDDSGIASVVVSRLTGATSWTRTKSWKGSRAETEMPLRAAGMGSKTDSGAPSGAAEMPSGAAGTDSGADSGVPSGAAEMPSGAAGKTVDC